MTFDDFALRVPHVLLPGPDVDLALWPVIACDQFTSQPEYWQEVKSLVGDAPSTLHMIYPEAWLSQGDGRIDRINEYMRADALRALTRQVHAFEIVWRETPSGTRLGLMAEIDLERYDPAPGSASLIRATEATVPERIPPRVRIRRHATLETPHAILLVDDPGHTLIEPLAQALSTAQRLYDTPLMLGGGRLWAASVPGALHPGMLRALSDLMQASGGLLFAVGDGNHSLATAKACWDAIRPTLSPEEAAQHPARYALVEIENLYDPALRFEPIHRLLTGVDAGDIQRCFIDWLSRRGMGVTPFGPCRFVSGGKTLTFGLTGGQNPLALACIQPFLDEYISSHPGAAIDYVHGEDALLSLVQQGSSGVLLPPFDKSALFPSVRLGGSLPRKTFSMGSAREKRYYMECRSLITP